MAPLCHVEVVVDAPALTGSDVGIEGPLPLPMYIAAFPFPGRDEGRRFTMTEDERGIIVESSLNSGEEHVTSVILQDRELAKATHLAWTLHRRWTGQSRLPYPCCWRE